MDYTCRVNIFQTTLLIVSSAYRPLYLAAYQNLVQKVLNELLLKRSRGKEAVKIGPKEFGHEVANGIISQKN
jgi:hypothetical protein